MSKFPKEIMVKWEHPGPNDDPFMLVGTDVDQMSEGAGETTEIAVYRIVRRAKIVCKAELVGK